MGVDRSVDLCGVAALDRCGAAVAAISRLGDVRGVSQYDDREAQRAVRLSGIAVWLFGQGHAVDLILGILVAEWPLLTRWRGWRGPDAALRLLPGALMLLAVRAALTGAGWQWVALALAVSFPVHLADLARPPRR